MTTEQERAAFEAWAASIGLRIAGKYAETIAVLCAESAFKAGYRAGRAALQSQDREDAIWAVINKLSDMTPRPPKAITYDRGWEIIDVVQRELCPAVDHARRIEGGSHEPI